jgi:hypothetical protein
MCKVFSKEARFAPKKTLCFAGLALLALDGAMAPTPTLGVALRGGTVEARSQLEVRGSPSGEYDTDDADDSEDYEDDITDGPE